MDIFLSGRIYNLIKLFFISALPVFELKGGIPIGFAMGLPWYETYIACTLGNMLPIPFIILFIRKIFSFLKNFKYTKSLVEKIEKKAMSKAKDIEKVAAIGLILTAALPIPGSGAWMDTLVCVLANIRLKYAIPIIFLGVVLSGLVVTAATYGVSGVISLF